MTHPSAWRRAPDTARLGRAVAVGFGAVFALILVTAPAVGMGAVPSTVMAALLGLFVGGGLGVLVCGWHSAKRRP